VRPVVVVVVLPFLEFQVQRAGIVFDDAVEQPIEPLGVDAVGPLHFSVEPRCGRPDVDVADALVKNVPVKTGREFRPVIGLNLFDMEPQPRQFPIAPRSGAAPTRAQGFAQSISAV